MYLHSLMDFEPVFHACLPKDKEKQTVRGAATTGEAGPPRKAGKLRRRRRRLRRLRRLDPRLRRLDFPSPG